jgi:hypothetical protein
VRADCAWWQLQRQWSLNKESCSGIARSNSVAHDANCTLLLQIIKYDKVIDIPNSMTVLPELLPLSIEMVGVCLETSLQMPGCSAARRAMC